MTDGGRNCLKTETADVSIETTCHQYKCTRFGDTVRVHAYVQSLVGSYKTKTIVPHKLTVFLLSTDRLHPGHDGLAVGVARRHERLPEHAPSIAAHLIRVRVVG